MRKDFDKEMLERTHAISGFTEDALYALTGVAYATAFIGKLPTREDLAEYLGTSTRTLDRLIKKGIQENIDSEDHEENGTMVPKWSFRGYRNGIYIPEWTPSEVFYSVSAELASEGLYFGPGDTEPDERLFARKFLNTFFESEEVLTAGIFRGYNITLEYLWERTANEELISVEEFCRTRFDRRAQALKQISEFYKIMFPFHRNGLVVGSGKLTHSLMTELGTEFRSAYEAIQAKKS